MADDEGSGSALSELESEVEQQQQEAQQEQGKRRSTRTATVTARNSKGKQKASDTSALPKRKTGKRKRGQQGAASGDDEEPDIPVPSPSHFQQQQRPQKKQRDASAGNDGDGDSDDNDEPLRDEQGNELEEEDDDESDTVTEDDEDDDDFRGPSTSKRAAGGKKGRNGKAPTRTATNGRPAAPRQAKKTAPTAAELAAAVRRRGGGGAAARPAAEDDNGDAEQATTNARNKDDFDVQPDNVIFNTVKNPKSAMEGAVQDWVEQYQADEDSRGEALAELVNFVLRCCGCNLSVDRHEAQDLDGIVDKLDDIQADFSKVQQASYPLASKSKAYKKFRESLHDFFSKFIDACSTSDILYDDVLCETLQSWLVAASSSKLRAFRHTATVLALLLVRALCEVAVGVSKDFADLQKQKDTEFKKRKADQSRLKVLEGRIKDTHSNKTKIERYFKEIFDAVFVHRYRDAEPSIRMECIKALGGWMDVLPDYFLEGNYLRYIGWMLTDLNKEVRHEATDCLSALYEKTAYIGSMSHFTERFKSRLVEMALSDADVGVRCAAVDVLAAIDGHSLLEDEQRDEVATLVYDSEQRVRFAVAPFIGSLVEEELRGRKENLGVERGDLAFDEDAALSAAQRTERDALLYQRMQYKILAELMVKSAKQLEVKSSKNAALDNQDDDGDDGGAPGQSERSRSDIALRRGEGSTSATQLAALLQGQDKDRVSMAVECLRKDVVLLQDWHSILDYLMLDHSASSDGGASETAISGTYSNGGMRPPKQTGTGKQKDPTEDQPAGNQADKNYRLEEDEETLMLGALVSSIRTAHYRATLLPATADDERDKVFETLTRALIRTLPALFARHQADPTRCLLLLALPQQMKLDMYLDMRVVTSYESLWDDVTKQFLSHTDVLILERAMETIRSLAAADSLAATNKEKKAQLEQAVLAPLRQIASEVELHNAVLDEDTIAKLEATLTRLIMIAKNWDVTAVMDEKDDGNASSAIDIVTEILDRGSMGFSEEEKMVSRTLELLSIILLWKTVNLSADEQTPMAVIELRDMLVERATEYALGRGLANIPDGVKTAAFKALLDLRIVAKNRFAATEDPVEEVELNIQAQYRCAGFVQAQIERYTSMIRLAEDDDIVNESEDELDDEQPAAGGKNRKAIAVRGGNYDTEETRSMPFQPQTLAQHAAEYAFNDLIASFSRALCTDVIDLTHASMVLAHHDRFGPFYDECTKWLAEALRHYGVLGDAGSAVAGVVTDCLKAALGLYLKSASRSDAHFMALARLLSNHIVVRKGFSIVKRLPSRDLVSLHTASIDHVASKVATLESQDKNTSRNKALTMFKALTLCAAGLSGKEAASIHAHVVKAFESHSVTPSSTSKYWEPYRAYEKKLVSLMSKDTGIKAAARRQVKKTAHTSGENGQNSGDGNVAEDGEGFKMPRAAKPKAAAKPKTVRETALPSRRSARASNIGTAQYADEDSDVDMDDEDAILPPRLQAQKPKARPVARKEAAPAAADTPSAPSTDLADDGEEEDDDAFPGAGRASDTSALPRRKTIPAKRPREASPPPFAGSLLLGGTPTFSNPPSPAAARTPDAPSVDRASTPEAAQREDDLDSLAGVPDSPPQFSGSQMSQQSEETESLPPPGKRRRAMF